MTIELDILNTIKEATALIDRNYTYVFANKAYAHNYKKEVNELTGHKVEEFTGTNEFNDLIKPNIDRCFKGEILEYEYFVTDEKSDNERNLLVNLKPYLDDKGKINGVIIIIRDKTSEKELKKDWENVVHAIDDMLLVIDNDFEILDVNQNTLKLFNKSKEEVIGQKCYKLFHNTDQPTDYCPIAKAKKSGKTEYSESFEPLFNKTFSMKSSPVFNNSGEIVKYVDLVSDISQSKKNELLVKEQNEELATLNEEYIVSNEELRQGEENLQRVNAELLRREELLRETGKMAKVGGWEMDVDTNTVTWSEETYRIHEVSLDQKPSINEALNFFHPDDRPILLESIQNAIENGEPYDLVLRFTTAKGTQLITRSICQPVIKNGKVIKLKGTFQDITEFKTTEQELENIKWLLKSSVENNKKSVEYTPYYGDVTLLNTERTIIDSVGKEDLVSLASETIDLLDTSVAVYEKNGDYAFGMFASGWCQMMDAASRRLCGKVDNKEALSCGKCHCHDNCWNESAKKAIESGKPTDIECVGGIHLYAEPIFAGKEVVGAINIGYGDPPTDELKLSELAEKYHIDINDLREASYNYKSRPFYIVSLAKKHLKTTAKLLGDMVERSRLEKEQKRINDDLIKLQGLFKKTESVGRIGGWEFNVETMSQTWTEQTFRILEIDTDGEAPKVPDGVGFIDQPFRSMAEKALETAIRTGKGYDQEWRITTAKGNKKWVNAVGRAHKKDGKVVSLSGSFQDITEKKIAQDKLTNSEENLRLLFENMDEAFALHKIIVNDSNKPIDYTFLDVNSQFETLTGLKKKKIIGNKVTEVLPNIEKIWIERYGEVALKGNSVIFENYSKDLDKYYKVRAYCPQEGYFATIFEDITDQTKSAEALRQSEEKYRSLVENLQEQVFMIDNNYKIVSLNQSAINILGGKDNYIGKSIKEVFPKHIYDGYKKGLDLVFNTGKYRETDTVMEINGRKSYIFASLSPLKNKEGETIAVIGLSRDISEKKIAEEALLRNQYYLTKAQEIANIGTWELDLKTNQLSWTEQSYKIFGVPMGTPMTYELFISIVHPDDREHVTNEWNTALQNKPYDIEHRLVVDNKVKWVREKADIEFDNKGNPVKAIGFTQDITQKKEAEKDLIKSERRFRTLVSTLPDYIWLKNTNGVYLNCNRMFEELYGFKESEIIGKTDYDFVSKELADHFRKKDKEAIKACKPCTNEEEITRALDSRHIVLETTKTPMIDEDGSIIGVLGIGHDITQLKKAEEEILIAKEKAEEADHLKSAFLANMSHEIRTPMNGILGFMELLKAPNLSGEEKERYINIIRKSGTRLLNTVNDIIDISKIDSGQMEISESVVNISEEIEAHYEFFKKEASDKGIELKLYSSLHGADKIIRTDKVKLNSIITNLIKNAIKYTDTGSIKIYCGKKGSNLEVKITDTGIGIPKNRLVSIFNRFEQADINDTHARQGSGLGLSISKAYVEKLGGKIAVESEIGKGSTFSFTIPWVDNNTIQTPLHEKAEADIDSNRKYNILIAEDDEISFEHLNIIIQPLSKKLERVTNGIDAVEYVRNNPDTHMVLMDIKMPLMNGSDATKEIRKFNKDVVIIAQTAYALAGDEEKFIDIGCNDYISKPIDTDSLLELIKKQLGV